MTPGPVPRPARPTIDQIRDIGQPAHVRNRAAAEHWVAHAYLRAISPYLTRVLLRMGASANAVTWLMILAAGLAGVATGWPVLLGAVLAALLVQLQMLLDCCDGEVARWRQTSSPRGVYLDRVGHYVAECGIAAGLGVRAAGALDADNVWTTLGLLLALLVALNKVENDLVHVARHYAGLPQMVDSDDVRRPVPGGSRSGALALARRAAGFLPFHRVFHSVELSLIVLAAALLDLGTDGVATRVLLVALVVSALVTVVGHLAAVLSSSRLR